jgi:hypothetical protein
VVDIIFVDARLIYSKKLPLLLAVVYFEVKGILRPESDSSRNQISQQ